MAFWRVRIPRNLRPIWSLDIAEECMTSQLLISEICCDSVLETGGLRLFISCHGRIRAPSCHRDRANQTGSAIFLVYGSRSPLDLLIHMYHREKWFAWSLPNCLALALEGLPFLDPCNAVLFISCACYGVDEKTFPCIFMPPFEPFSARSGFSTGLP